MKINESATIPNSDYVTPVNESSLIVKRDSKINLYREQKVQPRVINSSMDCYSKPKTKENIRTRRKGSQV